MLAKVKDFFIKLTPSKRKIIQVYAALLYNANIKGFISGKIFTGVSKAACLPGLNCYSCPGAIGACPLGSLQNALSESKTKLPTYVVGIILLYAIILGRTICGYLCPVGLIQELLYKIRTPKLKKSKVTRALSYFKYVLLAVLVILLPLIYGLQEKNIPMPGFCKYVCPAGTFEGAVLLLSNINNGDYFTMLGSLFTWKFLLLIIFAVGAVFIFRFFCRFFCPLGAIYGIFNKLSIIGVEIDKNKCTSCGACVSHCKMDIKEVGDHECIQCGECRKVCAVNAIEWKTIRKVVKEELNSNSEEVIDNQVETKKDRRITKKTYNIISAILASIILIVTIVLVNFPTKVYEINDVCEELTFTYYDDQVFDITTDESSNLLYFYSEISEEEINKIKSFSSDNLNIVLISENINDDTISTFKGYNVKFVKKDAEEIKKEFSKEDENCSVFINSEDIIQVKVVGLVSSDDYTAIIQPTISGLSVGNRVGDIFYNKIVNIIGSNEEFSVARNRGKITIINFWFTGCTPCVKELPYFDEVYKQYSQYIEVVAIHEGAQYADDPEGVLNFVNNSFKGYTIKFAYDSEINPYYKMVGGEGLFPMTFIIDQEGILRFTTTKALSVEILESEINKLLK